ncbi:MAG: hypothetical protein IJP81_11060 [Bacteroidales bacterium]|nr:hypothetical protein [Bacteroidales bacterium]
MKKMKSFSMAALVVMGAILASCAKEQELSIPEEVPAVQEEENLVTLTTTVGFNEPESKALTAEGVKTFTEGEKIAVIYKDTENNTRYALSAALTESDILSSGKSGKFTVALSSPKAGGDLRYIYPASFANASIGTSVDVNDAATLNNYEPLAYQDGTLASLSSSLDLAVFDGSLTAEATLPTAVTLDNKLAICAYTLKNSDGSSDITGTIRRMTVSDGTHTYVVKRSAAAGPIYVAIMPTDGVNISYTVTDGEAECTKVVSSKTYAAGQIYPLGLRMSINYRTINNATAGDIGKVVCASGHIHPAKTAVPTSCAAIGIVGMITSQGHGFLLALRNAKEQDWNTINAWEDLNYLGVSLKKVPDSELGGLSQLSSLPKIYFPSINTSFSNWCVASRDDYGEILINLGSEVGDHYYNKGYDDNVNAYITTGVGGESLYRSYWTTTDWGSQDALFFNASGVVQFSKIYSTNIRPVIGFSGTPSSTGSSVPTGAVNGQFSVSDTKKVYFSQGNLQYVGTWQFAELQWERFGADQRDDHRDLLGWGTKSNPNNVSGNDSDYSWSEWGENTITNGTTGYRTLTAEEWGYLLRREGKSALATVNGVHGIVFLPDSWSLPGGCSFTAGDGSGWTTNTYTVWQWTSMETNGAVFLPCVGLRDNEKVQYIDEFPNYWSSSEHNAESASILDYSGSIKVAVCPKRGGVGVRLVKDAD